MGNMVCHYKPRACTLLHHGMNYTAVIFDNGSVIEIDDRAVREGTNNWIYKVQSTVYLVSYTKEYNLCNFSTEIENSLYPGEDGDKTKEGDASEACSEKMGKERNQKLMNQRILRASTMYHINTCQYAPLKRLVTIC